jgi:signal transduction histidine kinase
MPQLAVILVNMVHALLLFLLVTILSLTAGKKGNRLGYYFALAYGCWLTLVGLEVLYIQTGYPRYFLGVSHVSFAIFAEVSILAFLLAIRFKWERREEQRLRYEAESHLERVRQNYTQEILKARLEIQENTFNNIGQEIHDNIGQVLTLAKLNLSMLNWDNPSELKEKTKDAKDQVSRAILDLRDLSHILNGDMVQSMGFSRAVATELGMIRKAGVMEIVYTQRGEAIETDPQKELILFRIFQEAVHNILRHSVATRITVELMYEEKFLNLAVSDNGQGFDPACNRMGNGITNMSSRAALLGATLLLESKPGEGTRIEIKLPLK